MAYTASIKGDKLLIEVDISPKALKAAPPSGSKKTRLVASTGGFTRVEGSDQLKINLHVTIPNDANKE